VRAFAAWAVHLFTASGAVAGVLALLAIGRGDYGTAVLFMLAAFTIDALDGTMARAVGVAQVLPGFDGRRLDDIVDYLNYAVVPAVLLVAAGLVPHWAFGALAILASAYGFAQADAKTSDDFFLGFPSYWNVIAIYAWLLDVSAATGAAVVTGFAILVFVPWKYVYPSKLRVWKRTTYALAVACALAVAFAVIDPARARALRLVELSLVFPAWYVLLSLRLGGLHRPGREVCP
jgi:phosphatidylcholine synthase